MSSGATSRWFYTGLTHQRVKTGVLRLLEESPAKVSVETGLIIVIHCFPGYSIPMTILSVENFS